MPGSTILDLTGRPSASEQLPALLQGSRRAADKAEDRFLPPGFLQPRACFEIGAAARGGGASAQQYTAADDEVLVIELADGGVLISSAARFKASLERSRPELIGNEGQILFDHLQREGAAARGLSAATGGLIRRIFVLALAGGDTIRDAATAQLAASGGSVAELGVTRAGTRALMSAIEQRLDRKPGVYCWEGRRGVHAEDDDDAQALAKKRLLGAANEQLPALIFVHGTGSSTLGSFGDLQLDESELWSVLERHFTGGIYAFEHHTLSESPIENAQQLLDALPVGLRLSLVSHSRGGLVADLLCIENFDGLIEQYRSDLPGTGDADEAEAGRVGDELKTAHAAQRELLRQLAGELAAKKLVLQRYVRVASPAQGTLLASANLDLFLSGLLTLIGQLPFFFGSPYYSAFKRVVLEIARQRTNAHLVPGIEAMLPDSPMARFLRNAPVRAGIEMAVIAGDSQGGNLLQQLGVMLTDFLLFDSVANDRIVNTASMFAGIAPQAGARALFDRGADVSHFRYFRNLDTRAALRDWLVVRDVLPLAAFQPLPGLFAESDGPLAATSRRETAAGRAAPDLPVVVVLPGIMGSHLWVNRRDRVWFDPLDIASGGLAKIAWGQSGVEAEKLFGMFYGDLCEFLATSHRVEPFAYDWRQPLDVLAERLAEFLDRLLSETRKPLRLLAHSMGGLVVRACIHKRRAVMDALMARDGARLIMLGTPNQGAYSMVENLLGKGDTLRSLARLDLGHDLRQVLEIVGGFPGALQLLPKPGFVDTFQGQAGGGDPGQDFQSDRTWQEYRAKVSDPWFGAGNSATPTQAQLDAGSWLWQQEREATPALPKTYESKSVYVFGVAGNTPCGVRDENGRLKMVGTTQGDGTVTWASGRIGNVGSHYYLPAQHGDLASTAAYFPALAELLHGGASGALLTSPPMVRGGESARPLAYDAGPPTLDGGEALARGLLGGAPRSRVAPRSKRRLEVSVKAMDLRFLNQPILLGHYEHDPIAGAEALVDRELLDGDLSQRRSLGLYAGPRGSTAVVLRVPNEQERSRGSLTGAVVSGLGDYDGNLTVGDLTEAVRAGVLRYLLQVIDVLGKEARELPLATLLLGYNSSANLSVAASVEALLRGVLEANARFHEITRLDIRVSRLEIVELYQDTAITAVYALRQMANRLADLTGRHRVVLVCRPQLVQGEGWRRRLFDSGNPSYWPRLIVSDADSLDGASQRALLPVGEAPAAGAQSMASRRRTTIAERLRFLYVGQRARAETVVQQRQPGLVETLVRQQIANAVWQEDFGRVLFQLLVPPDFKDAARQLESVVLVVDDYTANLPWELMCADDPGTAGERLPLAVRTPVVRQLATGQFRRRVRQGHESRAFVVGNPSVAGFAQAFPDPDWPQAGDPPTLPGAETEANEVASLVQGLGYQVVRAIGSDCSAAEVLTSLYQQAYRLVHVSGHGVFDQPHRDGGGRTGVVLSDGLLITAAEIDAMEIVPDLVFLNCCHLGKIDDPADRPAAERTVRDGNRLAASIARELMAIGVRCVVVAGWAVDDRGAMIFGHTFYRSLLLDRLTFGEAVFEARKAVWQSNRADITWGAFQAYGDPSWRAEARVDEDGGGSAAYASPVELLDELSSRRAGLARASERQSPGDLEAARSSLETLLKDRCPAGWLRLPALQSALAALWSDLGALTQAREAYLVAIQTEDGSGQVPIRDIEQLANVEARLGEKVADRELIESALTRLQRLDELVSGGAAADQTRTAINAERSALLGSAAKRLASLHARQVLDPHASAEIRQTAAVAMGDAGRQSAAAYRKGEGLPGEPDFRPYHALNRLALEAVLTMDAAAAPETIGLVRYCQSAACEAYRSGGSVWDAVMAPEAMLVESLLNRLLLEEGEAGELAFEQVARGYDEALSQLTLKPRELDSVVAQFCLLSRFCEARDVATGAPGWRLAADRLVSLAEHISPGPCPRDDRPPRCTAASAG